MSYLECQTSALVLCWRSDKWCSNTVQSPWQCKVNYMNVLWLQQDDQAFVNILKRRRPKEEMLGLTMARHGEKSSVWPLPLSNA